jgi:hypothetical protein
MARQANGIKLGIIVAGALITALVAAFIATPAPEDHTTVPVGREAEVAARDSDEGRIEQVRPGLPDESGQLAGAETLPSGESASSQQAQNNQASTERARDQQDAPRVVDAYEEELVEDYGTFPLVPVDANVAVAQAAEALRSGQHPERVGAWFQPAPFDRAVYLADPTTYLERPEPGRVFHSHQPSKDIPIIRVIGERTQQTRQDQPVTLAVRVPRGAPVTFTSFAGGAFPNQLGTQTVQADATGRAEIEFLAGPGTIEEVPILAASPMASESIVFLVRVLLAESALQAAAESHTNMGAQ